MCQCRSLVVLALLLVAGTAQAETRLLVLTPDGQATRPAFVQALRIQLADIATVIEGGSLPSGSLAVRLDHAAAAVGAADASFALWLEEGDAGDFVLHVVGRRAGRAVVEIVRMPAAADGPETDRALALKAREVIEEILAPTEREDPARALRPITTRAAGLGYGAEIGLVGATGPNDALGGLIVSAALRLEAWLPIEVFVVARFVTDTGVADARGEVALAEQSGAVGLRYLIGGRVRVGVGAELGARWLHAEGQTTAGTMGSASELAPVVSGGPELRLRLRPGVELRAAAAAEVGLWRQQFSLNGETVLDLGRVRAVGSVSVVVGFP